MYNSNLIKKLKFKDFIVLYYLIIREVLLLINYKI
jgi:hypothetical protein